MIAFFVEGMFCYCLDGDNMRAGLCKGLGFPPEDRKENIRRTIEVAKLIADSGQIVLCSLVSPYREDRKNARDLANQANLPFLEVFVNTPLEECERRDTKGLYKKARAGEIRGSHYMLLVLPSLQLHWYFTGFTGIDQVYEEPEHPDLSLRTVGRSIEDSVGDVINMLIESVSIFYILY
jgi:3'-phosphoadenosine 5'-phosphosulfate synthase